MPIIPAEGWPGRWACVSIQCQQAPRGVAMKQTLVEQLQGAIRASGLTLNELERRCGVSHAVLSRFLTGKRTLTLPLAAKVCETLGLELRPAGAQESRQGAEWLGLGHRVVLHA